MNKICLLILPVLFLGPVGFSQNLVPNYSFEQYTNCPSEGSEIDFATPWYGPTDNSTDYFNYCDTVFSPTTIGLVPHTGDAYGGIWVFNPGMPDYKEYFQVELTASMIAGACYYLEFYVALHTNVKYAVSTDNIGTHFSEDAIWSTGSGYLLDLAAHVQLSGSTYLTDSSWFKIYGTYTASGGEKFLTLGNFKSDANTDTLATNYGNYYGSYYLVDDVTLISCDYMQTQIESINTMPFSYPNPFSESVTLHFQQPLRNGHIQLVNSSGQVVREFNGIHESTFTIQRGELTAGIYFALISDELYAPASCKLILTNP
jgi:hypothetical protein